MIQWQDSLAREKQLGAYSRENNQNKGRKGNE
jgi:hypothetical protein